MNSDEEKQFNILCLSGGGFRGLYTAKVLSEIEEYENCPIGESFDLIAGTSIGGIIGIAIALQIPASYIVENFKLHGGKIFPRRVLPGLYRSKYKQKGIKSLVAALFRNKTINDLKYRLIVPTVNYSTGKPQIFKTPHHPNFKKDKELKLQDIALATSAAPYYLPVHKISGHGFYVDGGLYGNSPSMLALHEAQYFLKRKINNIHLLSIGTMSPKTTKNTKRASLGFWAWKESLFSLTISTQEQIVDFQLKHLLGNRYHRIDEQPSNAQAKNTGLDVATEEAIEVLEHQGASLAQYFLGNSELLKKFLHHSATTEFY